MNTNIDPYSTKADDNPKVAALRCGQSFARFIFHSVQKTLAESRSQFTDENDASGSDATQTELADRALQAIYAQCLSASGESSDACRTIRTTIDRPDTYRCTDPEESARLREQLEHDEDADGDELRREIVELAVSPLGERVRDAVRQVFPLEIRWFELGRKLEEGLCRPDIYLFQRPFLGWRYPVLCADGYSKRLGEHFSKITSFESFAAGSVTATGPSVVHVVRAPGDVAPHPTWWLEVDRYWRQAGLNGDYFSALTRIGEQHRWNAQTARAERIDSCVDDLFTRARSLALGALRIDMENNIVELEGQEIPCIAPVMHLLYELKKAGGRGSYRKIRCQHPMIFKAYHKLIDLRKEMDKRISDIVESHRGKPVMLKV